MEKLTPKLIADYYTEHKGLNVTVKSQDDYFVVEIKADKETTISSSFYEEFIFVSFFSDRITSMLHKEYHVQLLQMINEFNAKNK